MKALLMIAMALPAILTGIRILLILSDRDWETEYYLLR